MPHAETRSAMPTLPRYDLAVIGLGGMGSATLAHASRRARRVIGLEAYAPAHRLGSSHGDSRIIRLGYFEDPSYVPLLRRAYENWEWIERETGRDILTITGVLQIGRPDSPIVSGTLAACRQEDLRHTVLDRAGMRRRFPAFALDADEIAVFEDRGGLIRPEAAVAAHLALAARNGAEIRADCRVDRIEAGDAGVALAMSNGEVIEASRVVVATGPWITQLVPDLLGMARPIRQVVAWYAPLDVASTALGAMPVFLRDEAEAGSFFGFPALDGSGVKIGKHAHFREAIDPDLPDPEVNARDTALLDGFIAHRLPAAAGHRLASTTCRYTMLPTEDFLLDHLPGDERIVVASPCSGHGYKFASVVGEILADLALDGGTALPVAPFSFARHFEAGASAA